MKITINNVEYTKIKNISFSPETDIIGGELPINQFVAEIYTDIPIEIGQYAYLYGKNNVLWAKYWIVEAEKYSADTYTIECQSDLMILDRKMFTPVMYTGQNAKDLIEIMFSYCNLQVNVDSSLNTAFVSGFCPEQSAKERLQWICFTIGAYVQSFFCDNIQIKPMDTTAAYIPTSLTYYRPKIAYNDYVTAVEVIAYTYTEGTPQTVDTWVTDGSRYFIQTSQKYTLQNSEVSSVVPENIVSISDVTLINSTNATSILGRIAQYYFKQVEVSAEIVNNGEYLAGRRYYIDTGMNIIADGFIKSMDFTFGNDAKASITMKQADEQIAARVIIIYTYRGGEIEQHTYNMPQGYVFEFQNPYVDKSTENARWIYYPLADTISGTVTATGENEFTQAYEVALKFENWELEVYSVDTVEQNAESGEVTIS